MNNNSNNWTVEQTKELFALCGAARAAGKSLSAAFKTMSEKTSRSVNSVRNYYYGQAKTFELVPEVAQKLGIRRAEVARERFVPFTAVEVKQLIERVLVAKARGVSVRRAILDLAGGDSTLALRYQNKYRSVLKSHRPLVEEVMRDLTTRGVEYANPYSKLGADNFARLTEYIAALDDNRVDKFLSLIQKLT